jgi:predicted histidine transporter YuiF (NhaC family)
VVGRCETLLVVPIIVGGASKGLITAYNTVPQEHLEREIDLVESIGFLVGARIQTLRPRRYDADFMNKLETRTQMESAKKTLQHRFDYNEKAVCLMIQLQCQRSKKRMGEIAGSIILESEMNLTDKPKP